MSSANKHLEPLVTWQRSLIKILKSKGPKTDPCETLERNYNDNDDDDDDDDDNNNILVTLHRIIGGVLQFEN
jgi:hypothetical protein